MKICPLGAKLFRVPRRTDMTKIKVAYRNFANAPNNVDLCLSEGLDGSSHVAGFCFKLFTCSFTFLTYSMGADSFLGN
jgi:hypothetical protein